MSIRISTKKPCVSLLPCLNGNLENKEGSSKCKIYSSRCFQTIRSPTPKAEEIKQSDLDEVVVVRYGPQEDSTPGAVGVKGENVDQAFTVVETMPKFPEGQAGLMRYLARSIKYPVIAQKNKEQGRVIIQMIIGTDGSLSNVKVLRSVSPSLDAEAIRVVGNMPKWEPGMQKGQAVPVKYTLPITFRLQ